MGDAAAPCSLALLMVWAFFGWSPVDADEIFEQLTAIIARLEIHMEQLTIHVDELKSHTCKDEVVAEKARIKSMSDELERLVRLKEFYATRHTAGGYTHH